MSEKRLIDIDELIVIAFNSESRNDIEEEFKKLPKPTLADVVGARTLDSMTEEEAEYAHKKFHFLSNLEIIDHAMITKWFLEKGFNVFGEGK